MATCSSVPTMAAPATDGGDGRCRRQLGHVRGEEMGEVAECNRRSLQDHVADHRHQGYQGNETLPSTSANVASRSLVSNIPWFRRQTMA